MKAEIQFRIAQAGDVAEIVALLADDPLGTKRECFESPLSRGYFEAFEAINQDPNNEVWLAMVDGLVVGVLQLILIPSLTYQGGWRAQIEGVRVKSEFRSQGVGRRLLEWAISRARERRCVMVQLMTDKTRPDALRFYESLSFKATHEGLKLFLQSG